ncbi:hypothetical protein RCL1_001886 [Eukaryota sp. TZLM3-RCL]
MLESLVCPLHLGLIQNPVSLPCHHSFCRSCIQQHLESNNECPICSNPIHNSSVLESNEELERRLSDLKPVQYIDPNELHIIQEIQSTDSFHLLKVTNQSLDLVWSQMKNASPAMVTTLSNQFSLLQELDFPKDIVRVFGVTQSPPGLLIEQHSCSLQDKFNSGYSFKRKEVVLIIKSLLDGVGSLHAHGIGHCNITADNVMLNETNGQITSVKVSIPELRSIIERSQPKTNTTYLAPELTSALSSDSIPLLSIDVYALGVLFTGLVLNRDPQLVIPSLESRSKQCLENLGLSRKLYQLLSRMLTPTPIQRPSIIEVGHLIYEAVDEDYQGPATNKMTAEDLKSEASKVVASHVVSNKSVLPDRVEEKPKQELKKCTGSFYWRFFIFCGIGLFILGASFFAASLITPSVVVSADREVVEQAGREVVSRLPSLFYVDKPDDLDEQKQLLTTELSTILYDFNVMFNINWNSTSSSFQCRLTSNSATRLFNLSSIQFKWSSRGRVDRAISDLVAHSFDDLPSSSSKVAKVQAVNAEVGKVIERTSVSHSTKATSSTNTYKVVLTHEDVTDSVKIHAHFPLEVLVYHRTKILQHKFTCLKVENVQDAKLRIQALKNSIENFISDDTVKVKVEPQSSFNTFIISLSKGTDSVTFNQMGSSFISSQLNSADFFALSSCSAHGVALSNGSLWSWGLDQQSQSAKKTGLGPAKSAFRGFTFPQSATDFSTVKQVALGCRGSVLLFNDGHVRISGDSSSHFGAPSTVLNYDTTVKVSELFDVDSVFAGKDHYAALSQGSLYVWGTNNKNRPNNGLGKGPQKVSKSSKPQKIPSKDRVIKAALGTRHTLVLTEPGDVYSFPKHGDGTKLQRGSSAHVLGLRNVVDIAAGEVSSYALTASGSVFAWGNNSFGQLCIGKTVKHKLPQLVDTTGFEVKSIHSGGNFVLFLTTDGRLFGCGQNNHHQVLGTTSDNQLLPVRVSDFDSVKSVAVGLHSVIATLNNGTSYTWGSNENNNLGFTEGIMIKEPVRFGCNRF